MTTSEPRPCGVEDCGPYDPMTKGFLCDACLACVVECQCGGAYVRDPDDPCCTCGRDQKALTDLATAIDPDIEWVTDNGRGQLSLEFLTPDAAQRFATKVWSTSSALCEVSHRCVTIIGEG